MKQMIDACREIVKLATEIRGNQNIPFALGDSISERLYAVRGLLESIPLQESPETQRLIEIGRAVEYATRKHDPAPIVIVSIEGFIGWYRKEAAE